MRNLGVGELAIIEPTMLDNLISSPVKVESKTWGSVYVRALFIMRHAEIIMLLEGEIMDYSLRSPLP